MAFYDTYGDSKRAAQQNRIARDAQTIQAIQAMANFLQKGRADKSQANLEAAQAGYYNQQVQSAMMKNQMLQQRMQGGFAPPPGAIQKTYKDPVTGETYLTKDFLDYQNNQFAMKEESQRTKEERRRVENIMNRKLTDAEQKSLSQIPGILEDLRSMQSSLGTKDEMLGYTPFGAGQAGAQSFKRKLDNLNALLVYMRSGAQINEQEFKRLKKLLPGVTSRKEVDFEKLRALENELLNKAKAIRYGTLTEDQVRSAGYDYDPFAGLGAPAGNDNDPYEYKTENGKTFRRLKK